MATKEISQLPSTNVSNDTDLLMTRQGSQDRAVQVQTVRNVGTEPGQNLGVGSYGTGGDAISITSIYASNNANLIDRGGVYAVNGTTNTPVAQGELTHTQLSSTSATQHVVGENQESYWRKKVGGTWLAWVLDSAANKATVRTDLGVPSTTQALLVANLLQEIQDLGAASQETALGNLGLEITEQLVTLNGDFDVGQQVRFTRTGNQVILSVPSSAELTHSNQSNPSTAISLIPTEYRPSSTARVLYYMGPDGVYSLSVNPSGSINLIYRDWTGALLSRTSSGFGLSIAYSV